MSAAASETRLVVSVSGQALRKAVGPVPDGVQFINWDMTGPAPVENIDIVVQPYMGATSRLANLAGTTTRLVQSQSIGYDSVHTVLPAGHVYANAASVHETSTAELALALILASQRGIPDFVRAASEGRWAPAHDVRLERREPGLDGLPDAAVSENEHGAIGQAGVARGRPTALARCPHEVGNAALRGENQCEC